MIEGQRILVVSAHPDDELLGIGATINRLVQDKACIARAVILGEGLTSREDVRNRNNWKNELAIHKNSILKAQHIIGYESVGIYDFPDNRFDSVNLLDIIKVIEKEKKKYSPDIIFTHFQGDLNIDHQKTFEAVITACRPLEDETVKSIFSFETPSATEWQTFNNKNTFIPNYYYEIKPDNLKAKIDGLLSYKYETREYPHPRSPEALKVLAQKRGIEAGLAFAEGLIMIRSINK